MSNTPNQVPAFQLSHPTSKPVRSEITKEELINILPNLFSIRREAMENSVPQRNSKSNTISPAIHVKRKGALTRMRSL
jgi:threonine synthase